MRQYIDNEPVRHKHVPYPHQEEAVKSILKTFKSNSRCHVVMACGTGKTHVCLWVAERLKAKRVVVFVPSLSLINQLLHEWLADTHWQAVSCMAICSDETVTEGVDTFALDTKEFGFPVTTNVAETRRFLTNNKAAVQWVFCTYHSAGVLADAINKKLIFDLCICDEAHKTTGAFDKTFSIPLNDKLVPAKKKLFVTATPKHYDIRKNKKEAESKLVYSMDSEKFYGPRAYTLSFRQAVNLDIISDYKVLVPVIVSDTLKKRPHITGEEYDEKAIALDKATQNHDITKIITFHRSIQDADDFALYLSKTHSLPKFRAFHVNSTMPVSERSQEMLEFKYSSKSLITNARCLTEGTNIPAVDMVAFFNQKRSKIDIVQAIGRVMRKHGNKTVGYVFIPLYVEIMKGESVETAIDRNHYDYLWEVLQALSEQDEDLHQTIHYLKIEQGQYNYINHKKLSRFIEIMPNENIDIDLKNELEEAIAISVINHVGSSWDEMYGKLLTFKEQYGHCNVKQTFKNKTLIHWVSTQRKNYNTNNLSAKKIEFLEKIGFSWDVHKDEWQEKYRELIQYKKENGTCNVPNRYKKDQKLASWVSNQRGNYHSNRLSIEKIKNLEKIGFLWDLLEDAWQEKYRALVLYKEKKGTCNVPNKYNKDQKLANWVGAQRRNYHSNTLSREKIKKLEKIGFLWDVFDDAWQEKYRALVLYKEKNGTCNVLNRYKKDQKLAIWVSNQRTSYHSSTLSREKIKKLEKIGFSWDVLEDIWQERYRALIRYKEEYGTSNVPTTYKEDRNLANWVPRQRSEYHKNILSAEKINKLEKIGFSWDPFEDAWQEKYRALVLYKEKNGTCNVLNRYKKNQKLANWVVAQRNNYRLSKLSKEKIEKLEKIGFSWDPLGDAWQEKYRELIRYKERNGTCSVPQGYKKDRKLASWVRTQRCDYLSNTLSMGKIKNLEKIGFLWDVVEDAWQEKYRDLIHYKKEHGTCNVPTRYKKDQKLANWVSRQRTNYHSNTLSMGKIKNLEKIGFLWDVLEDAWQEKYRELIQYKKKNGTCNVPNRYKKDQKLANWVKNQRSGYCSNTLSVGRIKKLEKLDFSWKTK